MCPLRFILVFFSAILAGYFAWRTVRSSEESSEIMVLDVPTTEKQGNLMTDGQDSSFIKMIQNGFWVFVDMASGRYLWRNLREMKNGDKTQFARVVFS